MKDQLAHFIAGFIFGLLVGEPIAGAIVGLLVGLVREFTEWQLKIGHGKWPWEGPGSVLSSGSIQDMLSWTAGGLVGGVL